MPGPGSVPDAHDALQARIGATESAGDLLESRREDVEAVVSRVPRKSTFKVLEHRRESWDRIWSCGWTPERWRGEICALTQKAAPPQFMTVRSASGAGRGMRRPAEANGRVVETGREGREGWSQFESACC